MEIRKPFKDWVRDNSSQGILECFAVVSFFGFAIYLHSGYMAILLTTLLTLPLIAVNLYESFPKHTLIGIITSHLQRFYWIILIPLCITFGFFSASVLLYSGLEAILYFQMLRGLPKIFTAGEHFLNSRILISLLQFSFAPFSPESVVIYYPVLICAKNHRSKCLSFSGSCTGPSVGL